MDLPLHRWKTREVDPSDVDRLSSELKLSRALASLLCTRGYTSPDTAALFLNPRLSALSDPFDLPSMREAVDAVWRHIELGSRIAVYGDYDADGVTSTALMSSVLEHLGADVSCFLPERLSDGYGLSPDAVTRCIEQYSPSLIITVDCGTCSRESVLLARERGVDVVVTDHHEESGDRSPVEALVNPKLGTSEDAAGLAGVGVAFKLCHAMVKDGLERGLAKVKDIDLRKWLDLVAIGTVTDVVPLKGENRILLRHGLLAINGDGPMKESSASCGVSALAAVAGLQRTIGAYEIGFVIGPRINAAGRLGSALSALELLRSTEADRAAELAAELDAENRRRKTIEDQILKEARAIIDPVFDDANTFGIAVGADGWHPGTVGIVASRLCSAYRRPSIVVGFDEDGVGHGSCRSIDEVDIVSVLESCSSHLETYGGHKAAAGLSVKRSGFADFQETFNRECARVLKGRDLRPVLWIDSWVSVGELDMQLAEAIESMAPFGMGNPSPLLGVRGAVLSGPPRKIGKNGDHLKMSVACGASAVEAVAFGMGEYEIPEVPLDIAFQLQINEFRGRRIVQMNIKAIRESGE